MDLPQEIINIIIFFGILVSAAQCFFGYRIFKFLLGIAGFLLCGSLAAIIGYNFSQEEIVALLFGFLGGFLGAFAILWLYFIGIFLLGALFGGLLCSTMFGPSENAITLVLLFIASALSGFLALIFQKFMIIVSTAFIGAWGLVFGIFYFTPIAIGNTNFEKIFSSTGHFFYAILLCWFIIGLVGVIVQYRLTSDSKEATRSPAAMHEETPDEYILQERNK